MDRPTGKIIRIYHQGEWEDLPYPDEGMTIQEITNVDAGRNVQGTVVGQKVGRNIWKIEGLQWSSLTPRQWTRIKKLLKPFFVKVKFLADDNEVHTVTMYPGDRSSVPFRPSSLSYERFLECKFNLIDCGKLDED